MFQKPEVCILPVAGLSTRNLPATKVLHKGFLTLNSIPIIGYAVDCCKQAGIKEIVFIYSDQSCKHMFEQYYSPYEFLENNLREKNKLDLLKILLDIVPQNMKFSFALQEKPLGNGHAILMAKEIVGKRNFVVMWPDDVYINLDGGCILKELCDVYEKTGGVVENIMEFPKEEMVRYGALVDAVREGNIVRAKGLVEKPALENVPSNFASMGPYILPNVVMDLLPKVQKGTNGEINLTDAINLAVQKKGEPLTGVLTKSVRFDCGTNQDLAKANIKLSLMKNKDLRQYARKVLEELKD
ncbi:MAG: UTP--glucose-1-phosphate uridylyltransferase [Alphaproteobacteria bacterium]|nr:UTP--glucose-1-phosphate uridylyltransferase [Alphaproteobacteria bacterium]